MWDRLGARSVPGKIKLTRNPSPVHGPRRGAEGPRPSTASSQHTREAAQNTTRLGASSSDIEDRRWAENGSAEQHSHGKRDTSEDKQPPSGTEPARIDGSVAGGFSSQANAGAAHVLGDGKGPQLGHGTGQDGPTSTPTPAPGESAGGTADMGPRSRAMDSGRLARFNRELSASSVDVDALRELSWSGVPPHLKPLVWRLLLGYAPPNADRREAVLARRRKEYQDWVSQYYDIPNEDRSEDEIHTLRQISVDCPRTVPDVPFFQQPGVQKALERVLYVWAIRHPASGYVQGINDLVTPFLTVFLSEIFGSPDMSTWPKVTTLSPEKMMLVEADCFWCLCRLLDGIQDHYTFAQPGIQRLVFRLRELVRRIDDPVARHIEHHGLEFLQFAFRWFNCLLIREIPFRLVGRLWDTYLSEGDGFPEFLVYVCASFLLTWSDQLQKMDFQEMVLFLQHVPTENWTQSELEIVLSRAFMWRVLFNHAPRHLNAS